MKQLSAPGCQLPVFQDMPRYQDSLRDCEYPLLASPYFDHMNEKKKLIGVNPCKFVAKF